MKKLLIIPGVLTAATLAAGAGLASSSTSADPGNIAVTIPVSCNMAATVDTAHTATINPGQYQSDIGTTTFKTFCNDGEGFSIYAVGYSNEEFGNTKL